LRAVCAFGPAAGTPRTAKLLTALIAVCAACGPASDPAAALQGSETLRGDAWVDPALGAPGTASGGGSVVVWFDAQLLSGDNAYERAARDLASRPRSDVRREIIAQLQALSSASWALAGAAIDSLVAAGTLESCEPMWIVNGAACTLTATGDAHALAVVPGVARVFRGMAVQGVPAGGELGPLAVSPAPTPFDAAAANPRWNLRELRVPEVWAEGYTGKGVGLVIHDGGFRFDVEPTRHSLWRNPGESPGNGIDDDGNGYIDDIHGFHFDAGTPQINRPAIARGEVIHGNAVAALATGTRTVDTGVHLGVAPDAHWAGVIASRDTHEAIQWALLQDFDIFGMSFSLPDLGELRSHWRRMFEHGALAGLFFVSGAGNFGQPGSASYAPLPVQMRIPEDVPLAVFGVAGVDSTLTRPPFSSQGPVVWMTHDYADGTVAKPDLATVNASVIVPDLDGNQTNGEFRGNSFAAPHLAGVIALLLEADPEVSPWTLREILMATARDIGEPGFDHGTGAGLVDAYAALGRLRSRSR
jgi:hypothetical protein